METENSFPAAPETSVVNQPAVKKPSSKLLILLILLVIILATVVGVMVGYLLGFSRSQPVVSAPVLSPSSVISSPIPTPTPDPTANWKTYSNDKYGFSFKYPEEAKFVDYRENPIRIGVTKLEKDTMPNTDSGLIYSFTVRVSKFNGTVEEAVNQSIKSGKTVCVPETTYSPVRSVIIDGKTAMAYDRNKCEGSVTAMFIIKDGSLFEIDQSFGSAEIPFGSNDKKVSNQILSTFKFLK